MAWKCWAWLGKVGLGKARLGKARTGSISRGAGMDKIYTFGVGYRIAEEGQCGGVREVDGGRAW